MRESDVVVVGAGHNALVSAAYLAIAGLTVTVLEGQAQVGGDARTEELTLPGYYHDSCASAHTIFQNNPLVARGELPLETFGLRYLKPDPVFTVPFDDGESLTMWRDPERTAAEIARLSPADARAYQDLLHDYEALRPIQAAERNNPPRPPDEALRAWRKGALGEEGLRIRLASGLDIIRERFREEHVQAFIAWVAMMTIEDITEPFTGLLPFSLTAGRQQHSWTTPVGGSGRLPAALQHIIQAAGGVVLTGTPVRRIQVESGRAVGVVTAAGTVYRARRAVLSSAHVQALPTLLGEDLPPTAAARLQHWDPGLTMFVAHYAISEAPRYRTHDGRGQSAVAMGAIESVDNLLDALAAFRRGRLHLERPFLLCLNSSLVDPTRAPAGGHTLKLVSIQPYQVTEGPGADAGMRWDALKEQVAERLFQRYCTYTTNMGPDKVRASFIESPVDLERRNPNNYRGSCHGGASTPGQTGWFRPGPEWSGYRTPVAGLYLTGACTHPGGSISGLPGRNAARVLLADVDVPFEEVLARAARLTL
jgi:phytoene dehydrogenase-like protein